MVLEPKKKFQADIQATRAHQELVVSDRFRAAAEAALLEQVMALPMTYKKNEAAAAYYRIMGARDYLQHLLTIAEQPKKLPDRPSGNLNHNP